MKTKLTIPSTTTKNLSKNNENNDKTVTTAESILSRLRKSNLFYDLLNNYCNLKTIVTTRTLSLSFCNTLQILCSSYKNANPLASKAIINIDASLLIAPSTPENQKEKETLSLQSAFAKKTGIRINLGAIVIGALVDPSTLLDQIKKLKLEEAQCLNSKSILTSLIIRDIDGLTQLILLLENPQHLSQNQKFILKSIRKLNLSHINITPDNCVQFQNALNSIGKHCDLLPNLTYFSCGYTYQAQLTLPKKLNNLTTFSCRDIYYNAQLTLPNELNNLTTLIVQRIHKNAQLTILCDLDKLTTLQYQKAEGFFHTPSNDNVVYYIDKNGQKQRLPDPFGKQIPLDTEI